ncbi:M57 family metalloprotease [Pedobacter jeongneungensis]|uniref:M57 family metalloprotease n=1 Tax=Pedobacter jeongneungensis TaxID=947309 RepID=UPI000468DE1E|nr:M57 family metalloprotease [Pedobacter jeongneungensis]
MKNLKKTKQLGIILCSFVLLIIVALASCKKNGSDDSLNTKQAVQSKLTEAEEIRIMKAGFSTNDVIKVGDSYLVEGDILLSVEELNHQIKLIEGLKGKNGPSTEQYKTGFTLADKYIKNGQIKVRVDGGDMQKFVTKATKIAIGRYNDLKLGTTFVLETSPSGTADIVITMRDLSVIKSAPGTIFGGWSLGFPSADGKPAGGFSLNNKYYNDTDFTADELANMIAHEIGHCVGFRHTDYSDRSSCGLGEEGESTTSSLRDEKGDRILDANGNKILDLTTTASLIPGTVAKDSKSWMRACPANIRSFTEKDKIALYYLLGKQ